MRNEQHWFTDTVLFVVLANQPWDPLLCDPLVTVPRSMFRWRDFLRLSVMFPLGVLAQARLDNQ